MQTLADVCLRHNLTPPLDPFPGGDYRIDDPAKTGQGDGWLYLFADGQGGFLQNHRNYDRGETFFYGGHGKLSDDQKKELKKQREAYKQRQAHLAAVAADLVVQIWNQAEPATPDHPYLVKKNVQSLHPQLRMLRTLPHNVPRSLRFLQLPILIALMFDPDGRPVSAEYIDAVGEKRYHNDGSREASLSWVSRGNLDTGPVYLAEGLSTACSVADATNRPCVAAFDAGNLPKVAAALRRRYPAMKLIVCADDDIALEKAKKPNKGLLKAQEACTAGGGLAVILPDFSKLRERGEWSDFNDMATLLGIDAVAARLDLTAIPSAEAPTWLKDDSFAELRLKFNFGEAELASLFAKLRQRDLRWVNAWGTWMHYHDGVWEREKTDYGYDLIGQLCTEVVDRSMEANAKNCPLRTAKTRSGVERIARADRRLAGVTDQWDRHDWALNTPGGVVDLKTGELGVHRSELFLTHQTAVIPDWVTPTPVWSKFLWDVCCGDGDLTSYLQRLAGYCLTGVTYEQVLIFFYGAGRNGKGTFLDTLKYILSGYYRAAAADTFTESKSDRHKSELAVLMGARLVAASEVGQGKAWNDARIKELTGQDTITANFMRCDPFTFTPNFKLLISSNNKPRFNNVDPAIRARLQLVPWLANFETSGTKDPLMREKLQAEAPGILAWAIDGCLAWQRFGLQPPKSVREATQAYLDDEDAEAQWIEECCVAEKGASELLATLFTSWVAFAEVHHGKQKKSAELRERLEREGFVKRKTKHGVSLDGIRLKNATEGGKFLYKPTPNVVPFRSPS